MEEQQFLAGVEDGVGMGERDAPRFRQVQFAAAAFEQGVAEARLQLADLHL